MSSTTTDKNSPALVSPQVRLGGFTPEEVAAPFSLRCGALIMDYIIIVFMPALFMVISRASGNDGAGLLNSGLNDIGWLLGILLALVSGVLLPVATGKTLGKMIAGIRIVKTDGSELSIGRMIIRQVVAIFLFPLTLGISFFWSAFSPLNRSLHDLLAGSMVIYASRRTRD